MTDTIVHSSPLAAEAAPLIDGLAEHYARLYGVDLAGGSRGDIDRYPAAAFAPPLGTFLLLVRNGETIAGGAFMSHDDDTVEIKRMWSHPGLRRQGLARRILEALEAQAITLGYSRAYLTTGFRQPEAVALYLSSGYRPLFDTAVDPMLYRSLAFEKIIGSDVGAWMQAPVREPSISFEDATAAMMRVKAEQESRILNRIASWQAEGEKEAPHRSGQAQQRLFKAS